MAVSLCALTTLAELVDPGARRAGPGRRPAPHGSTVAESCAMRPDPPRQRLRGSRSSCRAEATLSFSSGRWRPPSSAWPGVSAPGAGLAGPAPRDRRTRPRQGLRSEGRMDDPRSARTAVTDRLEAWLRAAGVPFRVLEHAPVYTSEEAPRRRPGRADVPARACQGRCHERSGVTRRSFTRGRGSPLVEPPGRAGCRACAEFVPADALRPSEERPRAAGHRRPGAGEAEGAASPAT